MYCKVLHSKLFFTAKPVKNGWNCISNNNQKKKKLLSDKEVFDICESRFGSIGTRFVQQVKLSKVKSKHGHRFAPDFKKTALKQYYYGPMGYKSLAKDLMLPSKSTLFRMVKHVKNDPGFDDFIFSKIKKATDSYEPKDKLCLILIDEISIQRNLFYHKSKDKIIGFHDNGKERKNAGASSVLVVMARSISSNWKQPIGFFCAENFSEDELK